MSGHISCDGKAIEAREKPQKSIDWRDLIAQHWQQTRQRMAQHSVILCLEDTTELDFNGQETKGLGPLSYEAQRGIYVHPMYDVKPEREPLGILNAWTWARTLKDADGQRDDPKESVRWIEGYERNAEMPANRPTSA